MLIHRRGTDGNKGHSIGNSSGTYAHMVKHGEGDYNVCG